MPRHAALKKSLSGKGGGGGGSDAFLFLKKVESIFKT